MRKIQMDRSTKLLLCPQVEKSRKLIDMDYDIIIRIEIGQVRNVFTDK